MLFSSTRISGGGSGGGGGTIGGSISSGQIAFGSAADTIAGSANLTWNNATQELIVAKSGSKFLDINSTTMIAAMGDIDGVGNGTVITVTDSAHHVDITGSLDMNTNSIVNLSNPSLAQDAATKFYVDSLANGLKWKTLVDVATLVALPANTYTNGAGGIGARLTGNTNAALGNIDGYAVTVGQRILVKNEPDLQNGIYDFTQDGDGVSVPYILTRSSDANTSSSLSNAAVAVSNGSQMNAAFTQTTINPVVGTDPIVWVLFLNTAYSAGAGLSLTGQVFSLDVTHANDWSGAQTFDQTKFLLKDNSTHTLSISAANSTTTYGIVMPATQAGGSSYTFSNDGSGNLTWVPLSTGSVTAVSVATANGFSGSSSGGATPALTLTTTVTGVLKGNGTAISAATAGTDYSSGTSALATGILKSTTGTGALTIAVSGTDYQPAGNYITALTGDGTASGPGSVAFTLATVNSNVGTFGDSTHVGTFTVNGKGLITAASSTAISGFASSTLTNTHIFVGNGSNVATDVAVSGDLTLANTGAFTIANNAVTTAKINDAAVTYAKIQNVSNGALLGNDSGTAAAPSEITLANTLTFPTSTTLGIDLSHANTWTGTQTFNATAQIGVASSATGLLKLANSAGSNLVTISAKASSAAWTMTLPVDGGTNNYVLSTNGSGTTAWVAQTGGFTNPMTTTGDIIYSSDNSGTAARLGIGSAGQVLTVAGGVPTWAAGGGSVSIDALTAATLNTITDAANFVYNGNNGTIQTITLGASRTFTVTNLKVGIPYTFIVKQDGTGGRVLTWGTTVIVAYKGAGTPPISSAASAVDKYSFVYDGTSIFTDYALSYT